MKSIDEIYVSDKRQWENVGEYILFLKSRKAYEFTASYCQNKTVLDYGCGSGYGTAVLSKCAKMAIGVDINEEAIDYCRRRYPYESLSFQKISSDQALPFEDRSFDIIVSFQVIEHIWDVQKYLAEMKRILVDDGFIFLTTPNRSNRLIPFEKPWNPDHFREYSSKSLRKKLMQTFGEVKILGIYGTEEINSIERGRVSRSIMRHIFGVILPRPVASFLHHMASGKPQGTNNTHLPKGETNLDARYRVEDFVVGGNIHSSLDLLAVCAK
jgi:SAM-dependent methyltransferase